MPTLAADAKDTAPVIDAYEQANRKNKTAIDAAKRHNKGLQNIYNKQLKKKEEPQDPWKFWKMPKI